MLLLLLDDVTEMAHKTVARTSWSSWRLNGSCSLQCWKGWAPVCQRDRKRERERSQPRRAGHNKRLVEQVHLLRQIANLRLIHFRRARSSPTGYLYARCSLSSDPLILSSSLRLLWRKRSVLPSPRFMLTSLLERLQDAPLSAISRLPIRQ